MVLCWIFQREKNKLRTTHGTINAVGVGASQCCSQSGREIYCHISQLASLPNKIWLQKNAFYNFLLQLHVKWTRHKAAISLWFLSWCHSSCHQSKAFSDTSHWDSCSFSSLLLSYLQLQFIFSTTRKQIQALATTVFSLTSNSSVLWQVVHTLFSFQGLGWSCWAAALDTPDPKELSASVWAWDTGPSFLQQHHFSDASWVYNPQ